LYPASAGAAREEIRDSGIDDARLVDLDGMKNLHFCVGKSESPPAEVLFRKNCKSLAVGRSGCGSCVCCRAGRCALYHYGEHSWRFRVESSDNIEVTGMQNVTKAQIMEVMGADIGRNIFSSAGAAEAQLEQIPWVESASVMRFVPNRCRLKFMSERRWHLLGWGRAWR